MSIDIAATRARVIALPGSTGVDIALGLLAEVERLRAVLARRDDLDDSGAYAAAEDAERQERAAVVAWLREHWSEVLEQTPQQTARLIERGDHRRKEQKA